MKKYIFRISGILIVLASLASCTIVKRHYTRGFYVGSKSQTKAESAHSILTTKKHLRQEQVNPVIASPFSNTEIIASGGTTSFNKKVAAVSSRRPQNLLKRKRELACDTLFLRDGGVIAAQIIEISARGVKYRYCGGADQELRFYQRGAITRIKFANGLVENFETASNSNSNVPERGSPDMLKVNGFALAGFILAVLFYPTFLFGFVLLLSGLWTLGTTATAGFMLLMLAGLLCVLAFCFSVIGLVQINKDKLRYKGAALAVLGIILSAIPMAAYIKSRLRI